MSFTRTQTAFKQALKISSTKENADDIPGVITNDEYKIHITSPSHKSTTHRRGLSLIEEENFTKDTATLYTLVKHAVDTLEIYAGYVVDSLLMRTIDSHDTIPASEKLYCWIQIAIEEKQKLDQRLSRGCCFFSKLKMKSSDKQAYELFNLISELDKKSFNEEAIVFLKESLHKLGSLYIPNSDRLSPTLPLK